MAIYLIDKIKPKNNGTFPMVDAEDVLMPDGTRLSNFKGGVTSVNGQTGAVVIEVTNGKDGEDGKDGANGADGVSPSVTVEAITGGHRVSITDATGTKTFEVKDGLTEVTVVDSELSETSENPVQNKVVTQSFNGAMALLETDVYPNLLPVVGADDLGKVLAVVNGAWTPMLLNIPTDDHINSLIDAKLGVIENGSY